MENILEERLICMENTVRRSTTNLIRVLEAKNRKDRGKEIFKEIIT